MDMLNNLGWSKILLDKEPRIATCDSFKLYDYRNIRLSTAVQRTEMDVQRLIQAVSDIVVLNNGEVMKIR